MATARTKKKSGPVGRVRASVKSVRREGMQLIDRLRADAGKLVARSRAEVLKDVRALRVELRDRADRAMRDLERKVVRQFHAATQEQVRRLEKRVAKLEACITQRATSAPPAPSGDKAA